LATAAVAQAQQPQSLERVEVTGSNIKRVTTETVAPVEVITREQIQRTGQQSIADVLRTLPANQGGSFGESFSNSFAPGASGISLRGLGQKTTLVLLNGRRVAGYGFAQNLQDSFVDLNSIPSSAVERVEILKDGASAIYGSDAIAGVVNVILRRDFKGLEANLGGGHTKGGNDRSFSLTGGYGDLGSNKFNVFGVLDYYGRDLLQQSDIAYGATRDMRGYQGGRNFQSLTGGGTWQQLTATNATTTTFRAISGCTGTVMTGPQAVAAGLITPANAATQGAATNTFCTKNFADQFTVLPGTDRLGFLGRGTYEVNADTTGFLELGLSRTKTEQRFQAPFFAGTTGLTQTAAGLRPFPYNVNFAPGVAGNPFTTNGRFNGVLSDMGTRDQEITSDSARVVAGIKYVIKGWDLESALTYSRNEVTADFFNRITLAGTSALFGIPTTPQPPIPLATTSRYNLDNPAANSAAVRDSFRANFSRVSKSELSAFDTKASTEFGDVRLPGGPLALAVGIEARQEKLKDNPADIARTGQILGQGITATDGKRNQQAVFAELGLPLLKTLEGQLAVRYDNYSDYGSSTTPKVGLKFTPNDSIAVRAAWGKGFRAPTLPEISPSVATFFTTVIDPQDGVSRQISGVFAGNPNLKAETSKSATFGIVFEPIKNASVSLDWYRIDWRNVVASPSLQSIVNASCPTGPVGTTPCPSTATVLRDPATNQVVTVTSNYQNLQSRVTNGADLDARIKIPTEGNGTFGVRSNVTYVNSFKENGTECVGHNGCSNTIPRIKGALSVDWDKGPWSITGRANYTHSVIQDLLGASFFTPQTPAFQNGVYGSRVSSLTTFDLFARYAISKNFTISGSIINVGNKNPPFDPGFSSTYFYDFSLYDVRGRRVNLFLNYKM
jgi:iron complex outermembrane receptor protein